MDMIQTTALSLVQGLTEFLPISSSAHLILVPWLFGYQLQSLAFDVAVHLGTLAAVMLYFRDELWRITRAFFSRSPSPNPSQDHRQDRRLGWMLVIATLPLVLLGLPLKTLLEWLRSNDQVLMLVIAATTIGFGMLLWLADWRGQRRRDEYQLDWKAALAIGCAQTLAIIPGTSRSGVTMTAGLMLGMTRQASSRFSFLLSIPTILLAGALETRDLLASPAPVDWLTLCSGALISALVAYATIHFFLHLIERISMQPFVLYRLLLGGVILWLAVVGGGI
ncbi:undecaprenyl-diphosphate phosphatase [Rhabdochromatium marinum]|uniref:undecaprenyl-diphosphate phosphatase n=1 Tax=Rhabdochromatium marinum TaxID=48729 RepID=UPI0019035EC8|nr:undecaprenyl-diphosphate phosphatase [Rhabdochromatium marinum]MBK1649487.1 undecaprenyl-diphosphatase [Rhabdochromatium marinum]